MIRVRLLFTFFFLCMSGVRAQTPGNANSWRESETAFSRELSHVTGMRDSSLSTLAQQYRDAISRLLDTKRGEGALSAVLEIQDELKRLGSFPSPPPPGQHFTLEELNTFSATYRTNHTRIRGEAARRILQRADAYAQNLEQAEAQLTRQNDIGNALAARQIKERLLEQPEIANARVDFARLEEVLAQTAPPAASAPAAPAVAPGPVNAGNEIFTIKKRWKEFYSCMEKKDRKGAIACIDPEQVKTAGEALLNVWLDILQAYVNAAEVWNAKPDTRRVDLAVDGQTALAIHQLVVGNREEDLDPTHWVKRNGEWYILLKGKD